MESSASTIWQLVDLLEEGHEPDARGSGSRIDEPSLAGEHDRGEDVVGAAGHRDDAGFDDLGAVAVQGLAHGDKRSIRLHLVMLEGRGRGGEGAHRGELALEQCMTLRAGEAAVTGALRSRSVDELADCIVVLVGMLADIKGGKGQPDGRGHAERAIEDPVGCELAAAGEQISAHEEEVVDELGGVRVVAAGLVRPIAGSAVTGELQSLAHDGELEPDGFLGIDAQVARLEIGESLEVCCDRGAKLGARRADPLGSRQILNELVHEGEKVGDRVLALEGKDVGGHLGRDERIAVAVAADPGAEAQRARLGRELDAELGEGRCEPLEDIKEGTPGEIVEVVEGVAGLVDDMGLLQS